MTKKKEQPSEETTVLSPEEVKKQATVINIEQTCEAAANVNIPANGLLLNEYEKARDKGSASLYLSLSKLFNHVIWGLAIFAGILIIWWGILEYQLTYSDYPAEQFSRLQAAVNKLEGIFSYVLTTALGFAGGVCKMFLKNVHE